jgi:hypothetical protein
MAEDQEQRKRPEDGVLGPGADEESADSGLLPELLRRGLALGFSGLFMTEGAVRRAFGDTVPRDWVDYATEQSERTRKEFLERLSGEIARTLETLDLAEILDDLAEILDTLMADRTIEVKAEIRLGKRTGDKGEASLFRFSMADRPKDGS